MKKNLNKRTGWIMLALVAVSLTVSSCYEPRYSSRRDHRHDRWERRHHHDRYDRY